MEYTVDEVYGLSRNIPLNYVERHDVDERLRCNLNRDKHITIFGSSKQGKTCLRKHCLNENDYILVQCSNRWSLSDLNANILKRAGYELTESTNVTYEGKAKVSASVKILDATLGGEAGGGATKNVTHRQLELDLSDVNDIIGALNEANFHQYIVLEDFHYLKSEVQKDFAIELKAFHESSKLCFIIVGVWLDENKLVIYIGYADLSDFFYVWMRQSLKDTYPKLFRTMLVPKAEELVATPYRFEGSTEKARDFFEDGMLHTCQQIYQYAREDIPVTIYYAYKQSDTDEDSKTASTGWETMLSAIIRAGFAITGTWPMCTEMSVRAIAINSNALASSIVLVCRKRPADAPQTTRRGFIAELKRELRPALQKLQRSNIAPVDLAQSAIGPGMGVYSRYGRVLEADGSAMTVRSALQIINQELDVYFNEQDGELDANSRFCVDLYTQNAFNNLKFGDADTLARAKNTSVAALAAKGVLSAEKGIVRLLTREELPEKVDPREESIWLLCQQLTRAMETGGVEACAQIVAPMLGSNAERAKDLAYRLYTLAERKGWTQEGYAYNALVVAWREIQSRAAELQQATPEQTSFF